MLLSIVVISYNTKVLTEQTLRSVFAEIESSALLKGQTDIWVVDNDSSDGSAEMIQELEKKHSPLLHFLQNAENVGFAKANNKAIKKSDGEYILLLNSDTIVQPNSLTNLVKSFQANPVNEVTANLESAKGQLDRLGILAASLLNPDKSPQPQGGSFPTLLSLSIHMSLLDDLPGLSWLPATQHTGRHAISRGNDRLLIQSDWVGATAVMIRRLMLGEIGFLDENIFMYGEDIEFCMRAKDHHWDVAIDPSSAVIHLKSASSSSANAIINEFKGYVYIWAKHKPLWQRPLVKVILRAGALLRVLLFGTIFRDAKRAEPYRHLLKSI